MAQQFSWGWDSANNMWRRIACDADGRIIIDPSSLYKGLNIDPQTVFKEQNSQNQILFPGESQFADPWDGAIALRFPDVDCMITCMGTIYIYSASDTLYFQASGYMYQGGTYWLNTDAFLVTRGSNIMRVRFARGSGADWFIIFGETGDSWGNITVTIDKIIAAHHYTGVTNWDTEVWFTQRTTLPANIDANISDARI